MGRKHTRRWLPTTISCTYSRRRAWSQESGTLNVCLCTRDHSRNKVRRDGTTVPTTSKWNGLMAALLGNLSTSCSKMTQSHVPSTPKQTTYLTHQDGSTFDTTPRTGRRCYASSTRPSYDPTAQRQSTSTATRYPAIMRRQ